MENVNLPKVKLIPSYIANSHFTMENMNLHTVKLILNCHGNFQLQETRPFHAKKAVTKESAGINSPTKKQSTFAAAVTVCATNEEIVVLGGPKEYYCQE